MRKSSNNFHFVLEAIYEFEKDMATLMLIRGETLIKPAPTLVAPQKKKNTNFTKCLLLYVNVFLLLDTVNERVYTVRTNIPAIVP